MIEKVGVYCRLSDEDRDKINKTNDSDSIVNQRSMCLKYADQNGWNIVDIYSDDDFSGAGTFRPDFERLIKDCESGKINLVLCKSQSRFSRDMGVIEYYLHNKFLEWGVRFVSIVDNADTSIEANKKSRQINGLINEWYLDDLSQNIKKSLRNKREDGLFMGSFAPYGYDRSEEDYHKLVIDPVAAEVVKKIFKMYADGYGYHRICEYLNNNNILPRSVYKKQKGSKFVCSNCDLETVRWNPDTVAQILRNEVYIGNLVQGKTTYVSYKNHKIKHKDKSEWIKIENTHEAIIDEETFNKVQVAMKERTKPVKSTGIVHLFSGKVFCLECEHYMRKKNSAKHEYLVCSNNRDGYDDCINKASIRYDLLADLVLEAINKKIKKFYDKEKLNELDSKKKTSRFSGKINSLEKQRADIEKQISKTRNYLKSLYEDKVNGVITTEQFKDLIADYNKNEDMYSNQLNEINNEIAYYQMKEESSKNNEKIFSKYQELKKLNRVIVDEFIDKIYIGKLNEETNSRDIQIKWNFE